jgi:primary-amine oxidase
LGRLNRHDDLFPSAAGALEANMRVPLFVVLALTLFVRPGVAQPSAHPLDPLTRAEHWVVYDVLRDSGRLDAHARYAGVSLVEPPKADVLAWKPGMPFRREALARLMLGPKTVEAVVDLKARTIASWRDVPGVQPGITLEELEAQDAIAKASPEVVAALKRRGITDLTTVECLGATRGYFAIAAEGDRRLTAADCQDRHGVENTWGRPIDGLTIYIDLHERKVFRVVDTGPVPVPSGDVDFGPDAVSARKPLAPLTVQQPLGPGFTREGGLVAWDRWRFHLRVEPRRGAVISLVRYMDGDQARPVMYQGSFSEMFVPYMDPSESWYHRTFFDAGEFGDSMGVANRAVQRGTDCPAHATYVDFVMADGRGIPHRRPDAACLFERDAGDPLWRHRDGDLVDSRGSRSLVIRIIATIGNYDYLIDWLFQQDGSIRAVVGATGIVEAKGVASRNAAEDTAGKDGAYGRFVAEHTVATNHDHFFAYRLDLDVDGPENSLVVDTLVKKRLPSDSPRKSLWVVSERTARTESDAMLDRHEPAFWRIVSTSRKGPGGYPTSYHIRAGHSADPMLDQDDYPQRRAGFTEHALWVTPYAPGELYAAGDYPTQSRGGDGLPAWTAKNRSIQGTDIVAWYTFGMHHVVRAEDWPVMPTVWHEFELRPFDFFARNPGLDVPRP